MNDYANEHEQWEGIKSWWKENGLWLLIVIVLSLAASFSWRYWQQHQLQKRFEASQLFDQLLTANADPTTHALIPRIAGELESNYPRTPYADIAALVEAKTAADAGNLPLTEQKLQWAMDHTKNPDLREITRIRLARLWLAMNKPQQALDLLNTTDSVEKSYTGAIEWAKGDIYLAQKSIPQARQAYQNALNALPPTAPGRASLEMQLYQLPAP